MKQSEFYLEQARKEENDLKAMHLYKRQIFEKRIEDFREFWLEKIKEKYRVEYRENVSYSIHTEKYGVIDLFPKANKLLIRKQNKWIKPALRWIVNNLL